MFAAFKFCKMQGVYNAILCFLFSTTAVVAQNFEPFNVSENVAIPSQVETVDLNGDGLDDFIVAGIEKFYWFKNTGNSQFVKISLLDSVQGFWHFALFDWENDGDIDIFFTTNYTDQRVAWLENDGSENFTYHLISKTVTGPYYVQPWDLDKDNDVDILVSSSSTDQLYWLKNDGFNNYTPDTLGNYVNTFSIADLNGDNDWDIIFGRAYTGITYSDVRAFQNDGFNNFSLVTLKTGFQIIHEVIVEDVNGDGYFDIVVPDYYGDEVSWLKNDGTYGFSTKNVIKTNFDGPQGIALLDVNEDGKKDLIVGSYNADEIYYFQGQGSTSSFGFSSGTLIYNGLNQISDLAIGNFDNQNKKDFVHTDGANDEVSVWVNNGSQVFTQNKLSSSFDTPRAFDMKDLDGDGDQDVATVSNDGDMVAWMENLGNDEFKTHILITNYEEPYVVKINDLDQDGDNDIIAASDFDDRMTWWKNDGSGNFTMTHITTSLNGPRDLWIEDFDGDGDKDIAVICFWLYTKSGNTGAQLYNNDGNENFTRVEIDDDIRAGRSVRGADMNNDTLVDLVFSSILYTQSALRIAKNNGNSFTVSTIGALLCEDFELCDFDGDGDNDILALDANLDSLYLYENTGNLSFTKSTIAYFPDLYSMEPRDFDGDGDMDVVFTSGYSGFTNGGGFEWGLFRNDGFGNLTSEIWYQNLSNVKPLEVFDYELDGDLDVMLGFDYLDKITLYKNLDVDCYLTVDAVAQGATQFCAGDSVQLTASTTHTGIAYQWFKNNLPLTGDTAAVLMVDSSGFYRVEISDTGCTTSSNPIQVIVDNGYLEDEYFTFCQGSSILIDTLFVTAPGDYTFNYQSQLGCDSTVITHVSMTSSDSIALSAEICNGDSYDFNGTLLTQSGTYTSTLANSENCDSVVTLSLTVRPTFLQNQAIQICTGDSAFLPGGSWKTQGGLYQDTLQSAFGCDSIWTTQINVSPIFSTTNSYSICQGDSLLIHGVYQKTAGIFIESNSSAFSCDSINTVQLSVLSNSIGFASATICQGDSVLIGGTYQKLAGVYVDTLMAYNTCDSILSTTLNVLQHSAFTQQLSICQGDSIFLANAWQTTAGNYVDNLLASNGCDSMLTSTLIVNPTKTSTVQLSICQGDSIFLANAWQTTTGNYVDNLLALNGCDSMLTSTLTVNPTKTSTVQLSICQGDSVFAGGNWQKTAGTFVDVFSTSQQCDSIVATQLSVNAVDTSVTRNGNNLTANASAASYQWLDCGLNFAAIAGASNALFVPVTNGNYAVQITQNGCIDTSECFIVSNIGLTENEELRNIVLFPNPSSGQVEIRGNFGDGESEFVITVIGMNGSILHTQTGKTKQGELRTTLDLSHAASGNYQVKIEIGEEIFVKPVIIRK